MAMGKKADTWRLDDLTTDPHVKAAATPTLGYAVPSWVVSHTPDLKGTVKNILESASMEALEEYGEIIIKRLEELRNE